MKPELTILGCGSAVPTKTNNPSGQILTLCDKDFLIDCGEGTQNSMRQLGVRTARLYTIFISHLHGDHCFGILGLLTTFCMMNRTQDLHIYTHKDLEQLLTPLVAYHCPDMPFRVIWHAIDPKKREVIFEDRTLTVTTLPLRHTVPTCGFLFEQKQTRAMRERGERGFTYAYCSDTGYKPAIVPWIKDVDVLYHEATYTDEQKEAAHRYQHSTARQAAKIALKAGAKKLIIGHFSARILDQSIFLREAKEEFDNVILATDKTTLPLA